MDIESKTWNYSSTGTKVHAFLDGVAICRSSIRRPGAEKDALDYCEAKGHRVCAACEVKFNAAIERGEASMAPSTGEGDYLPPAAEVTETAPATEAPATHHYNALGGQRFIEGRGWVNHCRVCQEPEGQGDHFHNKETAPAGESVIARTKRAPAACCDHAPMYHGARGCDLCACATPRTPVKRVPRVIDPKPVGSVVITAEPTYDTEEVPNGAHQQQGQGRPAHRTADRNPGRGLAGQDARRGGAAVQPHSGMDVSAHDVRRREDEGPQLR